MQNRGVEAQVKGQGEAMKKVLSSLKKRERKERKKKKKKSKEEKVSS